MKRKGFFLVLIFAVASLLAFTSKSTAQSQSDGTVTTHYYTGNSLTALVVSVLTYDQPNVVYHWQAYSFDYDTITDEQTFSIAGYNQGGNNSEVFNVTAVDPRINPNSYWMIWVWKDGTSRNDAMILVQ